MIEAMRRESSTVVALVGAVTEPLLAGLAHSPNVSVVRPPEPDQAGPEPDRLSTATRALAEAGHRMSPFVLVPADPLAGMAAQWQAMWDLSARSPGSAGFEAQAAEVLAAWRAHRFELPDYYLALTPVQRGETAPDLYLGPLRAARPRRVEAVVSADDDAESAGRVLAALRSLPHGPWWPPLDELIDSARHFFPGRLTEGDPPAATATGQ
jgi:hypothetical protein